MQEPESAARATLFRSLLIYTAMLIADLTVVAWIAVSDPAGPAYVTMSVVAAVGLLIAYQVYAHIRDLREPLAESEGTLRRVWTRADLIIAWHSYYVTVDRMVLRVRPEEYVLLEDRWRALGRLDPPREMYVKVVHFPRTLNVVSIHEIIGAPPGPSAIE